MDSLVGIGIGGCFVAIFGLAGIGMLVKYFLDKKKAGESQNWSSAMGKITESYVRRKVSTDSDGDTTTSYYPEVRYTYQYLGTEFSGDRIAFGGKVGGGQNKAYTAISSYPVGKDVTVYYDPNNPEDAVLERRMAGATYLIMGIIFLFFALASVCIGGIVTIAGLMN